MADVPPIKTNWWDAEPPFKLALTTEGELTVEWGLSPAPALRMPQLRFGIVIPAEQVKILKRRLQESETIRDTLSAKPPTQGPH